MDKRISYFVTIDEDDVVHVEGYDSDDSEDRFFTDVSKVLALADITREKVMDIIWHGERAVYMGWEPGMVYEYSNKAGDIIWSGRFPELEH